MSVFTLQVKTVSIPQAWIKGDKGGYGSRASHIRDLKFYNKYIYVYIFLLL